MYDFHPVFDLECPRLHGARRWDEIRDTWIINIVSEYSAVFKAITYMLFCNCSHLHDTEG